MEKRRDRDNEWEKDWFINVGPGLPDNESLKCIVYIYHSFMWVKNSVQAATAAFLIVNLQGAGL